MRRNELWGGIQALHGGSHSTLNSPILFALLFPVFSVANPSKTTGTMTVGSLQ